MIYTFCASHGDGGKARLDVAGLANKSASPLLPTMRTERRAKRDKAEQVAGRRVAETMFVAHTHVSLIAV